MKIVMLVLVLWPLLTFFHNIQSTTDIKKVSDNHLFRK